MNQYLYPWHDLLGHNEIGVIKAKSYTDLLEQLGNIYGVYIGDIYDIIEFQK